jgi:outer membrane protein TolC
MKYVITASLLLVFAFDALSQAALTIAVCYEAAEANYPLIKERGLIGQTRALSLDNAARAHLPKLILGGHATYQSEVTRIPIEMPGVEPLSKDQYRLYGEISQTLYQGGLAAQQEKFEEANASVEAKDLSVQLYQIKDRVNELFFGILLLQEQAAQSRLVKQDIQSGLKKTQAAIVNGTAIRSAADILKAELLRIDQRIIEAQSAENSFRKILGLFTNLNIDENTVLEKPRPGPPGSEINRPEVELFRAQHQRIDANLAMLSAGTRPRLDLFVQGGYGRPGLNMLNNTFDLYYLGGIRFSWQLSGQFTLGKEKQILILKQQSLDVQKETFLFNTMLALNRQEAEVEKLLRLIEVDNQIISLRTAVTKTAETQLDEGVITSTEFIREVNAEDQAKQNRALHEIQLLMARAKHQFTSGQ